MALPILHRNHLPTRRSETVRDTALTAFNPWRELDEMSRWFDDFMGRSFEATPVIRQSAPAASPVELYESPDELRLFAYLPGAHRDAFDVSVTGSVLTVKGERQPLIEGENWIGYGAGLARSRGSFESSYTLPCEVEAEQIQALYRDGVLEIRLPKAERARVKTVKVNVQNQ